MTYDELQQAILDDTHRPDLSVHVERFIRQCEGMIRRDLKGYVYRTTLTDSDRSGVDSIYNLPSLLVEVRHLSLQGRQGDALTRVAPGQIRRLDSAADVLQYCQNGDGTIEFRGTPGTADIFDLVYFGWPEPLSDAENKNELLTDHESIYMSGSKFFLYQHTQDRELASDELQIFHGMIDTLNEMIGREIGGANVAPSYNFSGGSSY